MNGAASFEFKFGLPVSEPVLLAASLAGPGPRALRQAWADSQVWPESRPAGCPGAVARRRHGQPWHRTEWQKAGLGIRIFAAAKQGREGGPVGEPAGPATSGLKSLVTT